ncbi:MAG: phosphopantetheine-binding protein [Candidatus Scalindua sp.]|nr:phosphopantetheine-binding protein [Candidatus Scalindua sp.]
MNETRADIEDRVRNVILKRLNLSLDAKKLKRDTPLIGKGLGLDSVRIIELVVGLEEEFKLFFDDSEMSMEIFENIIKLSEYISGKLGNRES